MGRRPSAGALVKTMKAPTKTATPALAAWRAELAVGKRTAYTFDPLWRAACSEMNALEAEAAGLPEIGAGYRREALEILRVARKAGR